MATRKTEQIKVADDKRDGVLRGGHVLTMLLAAFGVVLAVNAIFVTYALGTWSGLSVEQPYDRGIRYNQVLKIDQAELALGWSVHASYDGRRIEATITDRSGAPVDGATVTARLERPTNEGMDQELSLTPAGSGRYDGHAAVPLAGQWDLRIAANRGSDRVHQRTRVLVTSGSFAP